MPKGLLALFLVGVLAFAGSVIALIVLAPQRGQVTSSVASDDPRAPDPGVDQLKIPEFTLVNQDGETVDESLFEDHFTVTTLFFTHCILVCPEMSGAMARVHNTMGEVPGGAAIGFVSITVDPQRDTPEVIRDYGSRYGADFDRWSFVTGDRQQITAISREGLLFELQDDEKEENKIMLPDGSQMANIVHPSRLILVGPDRRVIGLFDYRFDEQLEMLEERLRAILAAG